MRPTGIRLAAIMAAACLMAMLAPLAARAQTFSTLYSFTGQADGALPIAGVILDAQGNLYGTTFEGGSYGGGTVFTLSNAGKETVLYSFIGSGDGAGPYGGVIRDAAGNIYGTTVIGGLSDTGVVFRLSEVGKYTKLYSVNAGDGSYPYGGVIQGPNGKIYGTTAYGGAYNFGTVFQLNKAGQETNEYDFTGGADGSVPLAGLIQEGHGNIYGTSAFGGAYGYGTVFEVSKTGKEMVLYSFTGTTDGAIPIAGLFEDADGNFYGTTEYGGTYGYGVVFEVSGTNQETVLYSFTGGADGASPYAGVIQDSGGNIYGTTYQGGAFGYGAVFEINTAGQETVLYSFTGGADGANPHAALIEDSMGNLYSTSYYGGAYGYGTVFKLTQ